ncbi:5'/3'-nucleotidase SurE [Desulfobacterales bacterium HSG16]|nr:5'/3'-nucleotidase SurE [Desulfobacterales bacterium HSG16]
MNILLTNDDGIYACGLWALYDVLEKEHDIMVVAPDRERSGVSHSITLYSPLRVKKIDVAEGKTGYAVNGKPADCVKLALSELADIRPDMVISGINPGENAGVSLNYSGTVAAAREAALYGISAIAVSIKGFDSYDYKGAALFINQLVRQVNQTGLPYGTFLNVNLPEIPISKVKGVSISRQDMTPLDEYYEKRTDPRNGGYYWLGSDKRNFKNNPESDGAVLKRQHISITPIHCDLTDDRMLDNLKSWNFNWER